MCSLEIFCHTSIGGFAIQILSSNLDVMFTELKRPRKHLRAPKTDEHEKSVFSITADGFKLQRLSISATTVLYVTNCSRSLPQN